MPEVYASVLSEKALTKEKNRVEQRCKQMAQTEVGTGLLLMRPRIQEDRGGFTLIELVVCLSILTLLGIIALPMYHHFLEKAKAVEAKLALSEVDGSSDWIMRIEAATHRISKSGFSTLFGLEVHAAFCTVPSRRTRLELHGLSDALGWTTIQCGGLGGCTERWWSNPKPSPAYPRRSRAVAQLVATGAGGHQWKADV